MVSVTYENERISIKNSLPYLKYVLRLSRVVHRLIYGRFMGCNVNGFLSLNKEYQGWGLLWSGLMDSPKENNRKLICSNSFGRLHILPR